MTERKKDCKKKHQIVTIKNVVKKSKKMLQKQKKITKCEINIENYLMEKNI